MFMRKGFAARCRGSLATSLIGIGALAAWVAPQAKAGVFNLPHFVEKGNFAVGLEPELTLTDGAGLAGNFKYTQGVNDFSNAQVVIGTGGGPRKFRLGGALTFDFFPDLPEQPGMGIALRGTYYRLRTDGQLELQGVPYIHKSFVTQGNEVEPFLAFPAGAAFSNGRYLTQTQLVVGSMFKNSDHVRYSMEFGMAIKDTESYISAGVTFYP